MIYTLRATDGGGFEVGIESCDVGGEGGRSAGVRVVAVAIFS